MSLLGTPRQVTRTFKNIGRIKQISTVFAKYGFQELMVQMDFGRFIPEKQKTSELEAKFTAPERFRMALEELGPTFIKLGQLLSSRSDLLPAAFAKELSKLQDSASPLPFALIQQTVEAELGSPLETLFLTFQREPLASASIGQVHEAVLKDGTNVVVKVQRPGIEAMIKTDVSVLSGLAAALEKYFPETRVLAPQVCVEEFFQLMSLELNFTIEANNILKSRENLRSIPEVYVPDIFLHLSSHKVLVIERLQGVKLDNAPALDARGLDRKSLAETAARAFLKSALEDGFFHGDLHMGNLFALPGNSISGDKPRLGLIDFGIMGYLSPRARESLLRIFVALSEEDFESLCLEYAELGASHGRTDLDSFQRALQTAVAPYLGLPLASMNVGRILIDATAVAARHHIRIPREWMLIFKALYTLEGTCHTLDPSFNPMPLLESYVTPLLQPAYSWKDFSKDMLLGSRDVQQVAHTLPRQLHWFFKRFAANGYALETRDASLAAKLQQSEANFLRLSFAILSVGMTLGGLLALHLAIVHASGLLRVLAFGLFGVSVYGVYQLVRGRRFPPP